MHLYNESVPENLTVGIVYNVAAVAVDNARRDGLPSPTGTIIRARR